MVGKLLSDWIVHTLGKICGRTETSSDIMDMLLRNVTVHFCHIFVFSDNKKMHKSKKMCRKLAEFAGCSRVFSVVPVASVPGNSIL